MAKKKEETLSLATVTSRDQIPDLLNKVISKKKDLKKAYGGDVEDLTNDDLQPFGKISKLTDVPTLVKAISSIKGREAAYEDAFKLVTIPGVVADKYPFRINNTSSKRWVEVINKRIGQITYEDQMKKLDELEKICEKYVSDDQRFANDLAKIGDVLDM